MTTDTIRVKLSQAERHTLAHLLREFIIRRAWEAIRAADRATDLQEGAEQARLFAQLQGLAEDEGRLPLADLDAHRTNLLFWAHETEATVDEHEESLVEVDGDQALSREERDDMIKTERQLIVVGYAHACVCEKIVGQIDAAREAVAA